MVKLFTAKEARYLQSMFYASEYQPAARGRYDGAYAGAFRVLTRRIAKRIRWLWRSKPIMPRNMELLKSIALRYNMPANMFTGAPDQQRDRLMQWVSDYVFGMIRGNDYAGLRRLVKEFAPKNRRILGDVIRYAKLEYTQAKLKYALPSPPAVWCVALCVTGKLPSSNYMSLPTQKMKPGLTKKRPFAVPRTGDQPPASARNSC